jgi:hypothetical protein
LYWGNAVGQSSSSSSTSTSNMGAVLDAYTVVQHAPHLAAIQHVLHICFGTLIPLGGVKM